MGREKGEGEDWGELGRMGWVGCRKGGYGSREVNILIKGVLLGFAWDFSLEGFPGSRRGLHRLFFGQQRRGSLNWPCPIATLMNILHITIEPSSGDGWR